jgi:hypothetical protein
VLVGAVRDLQVKEATGLQEAMADLQLFGGVEKVLERVSHHDAVKRLIREGARIHCAQV